MNKNLFGLVIAGLLTSQLLSAAAAVQPLSDQDLIEIKNMISEHLYKTKRILDAIAKKINRINQLIAKNPSLAEKPMPQGNPEETLFEVTYSPARNLFLVEIKKDREEYHKSLSEILKLRARLTAEGFISDPRLSSLWEQLEHYHRQLTNLVERLKA